MTSPYYTEAVPKSQNDDYRDLNHLAFQCERISALNGQSERLKKLQAAGDDIGTLEHLAVRLALSASEAFEAIEELRDGRPVDEIRYEINGERVYRVRDGSGADWTTDPDGITNAPGAYTYTGVLAKPEGVPIEIADIIIRALSVAGALKIDIHGATLEKMVYNFERGRKHEKRF